MEDQLMKLFSTVSCASSLRARIADQPAPQAKLTLAGLVSSLDVKRKGSGLRASPDTCRRL